MIKLTGLWEKKDKNGSRYLVGNLGNAKVFIFPNKHKEKENQPDYELKLVEKEREEKEDKKEDGIPF